jgi:hypothetical protein
MPISQSQLLINKLKYTLKKNPAIYLTPSGECRKVNKHFNNKPYTGSKTRVLFAAPKSPDYKQKKFRNPHPATVTGNIINT